MSWSCLICLQETACLGNLYILEYISKFSCHSLHFPGIFQLPKLLFLNLSTSKVTFYYRILWVVTRIMLCIHYYSIMQNIFTTLKFFCASLIHSFPSVLLWISSYHCVFVCFLPLIFFVVSRILPFAECDIIWITESHIIGIITSVHTHFFHLSVCI